METSVEKTTYSDSELQKIGYTNEGLQVIADIYKDLTIAGVDDKDGYAKVLKARIELRDIRNDIRKKGKALREGANTFISTVIKRESELILITSPIEEDLEAKEAVIDAEIEAIKKEKIRKENDRIQNRINSLAKFNYAVDYIIAKEMSEEKFNELITQAEIEFTETQNRLEEERLEEQRKKEQADFELKVELERLQAERHEFERLKEEQAVRDAAIKIAQDAREAKIKAEQDRISQQQRIEREKIEADKKAFEAAKEKAEQERRDAIGAEKARLADIEQARIDAEQKLIREAEEKKEADRLEALRPDKEKIAEFAVEIVNLMSKIPACDTKEGKQILNVALNHMNDAYTSIQLSLKQD